MGLDRAKQYSFEQIYNNIYRFHGDCCAVYVLTDADRAILIDLGSGAVLDAAARLGVSRVDGIYLTHAHRDQWQGAPRAIKAGIPIHLPKAAESIVRPETRQDFQAVTPLLGKYVGTNFEPPHPQGEVRFDIEPNQQVWFNPESFEFGRYVIDVYPAPGHCPHQVAYLFWEEEESVLFCGDEIHSEGKIHEPYHLETDHYTGTGARAGADSLRVLRSLRPTIVCPSHGPIFRGNSWDYFLNTELALEELARLKDGIFPGCGPDQRLMRPRQPGLVQLSPHIYSWQNSFFLLSESGGALMFDCGNAFEPELWGNFAEAAGGRTVEAVLITHIHCDHLDRIDNLRGVFPEVEVWVHEKLVPIVENPHEFRRPYLAPRGVKVDRALKEGKAFRWNEYEFRCYDFPGQTDMANCYETRADGKHILFTGDNFYPSQQWGGTGGLSGLNGGHPRAGWRRSIQLVMDLSPEWILCAHTHPFVYRREHFEVALKWTEDCARQMENLAPDGCLERHHNPHFIDLLPYTQPVQPGQTIEVKVVVSNPYPEARATEARLVVPNGWKAVPETGFADVPVGATIEISFSVQAPRQIAPKTMLTADIVFGSEYLGEKAECYLNAGKP